MGIFSKKQQNATVGEMYKMITETGNGFYSWNGKLYQSDIVRSCIRPDAKAVGKLVAKHIRTTVKQDGTKEVVTNPTPYIRFLLEEPNEYMSGQVFQEKLINQLRLNNNAFAVIIRDSFGLPCALYPVPCTGVEARYINNVLHLKFYYQNGKSDIIPYSEIIHLRSDFYNNDLFGANPTESLTQLMNVIGTIDHGTIQAVKNGGAIKWLIKVMQAQRDEDLKKYAQNFANNFLSMSSDSFGVAAVDSKADAVQITPHDYVPGFETQKANIERLYSFFNTNEKIVKSEFNENEWTAYYEAVIEPIAIQMANEFTRKLFTRKERGYGNKIIFESSNLTYASMQTKLNLVQFVDRAIMTPNEVREALNLAPIDGGDVALLRKDTGIIPKEGGLDDEGNNN